MVAYDGTLPPGDVAGEPGQRQGVGRWKLATAAGWLTLGLACVALAAVEHERSRAAATGTSVLCGSLLSCSDGLERESLASVGRVKTQSLEEEEGDGSQKPETVEQAIDGFDLFTFGGEAPDSYEPTKYFARYQQPGDDLGDVPRQPAANALDTVVGSDAYKAFNTHSQFLKPGDVPFDQPASHHKNGFYNLFGALSDMDENLMTGEVTEQACCVCIPGAPDYKETSGYHAGNVFSRVVDGVETSAEGGFLEIENDAGTVEKDIEFELGLLGNGVVAGAGAVGSAVGAAGSAVAGSIPQGGAGAAAAAGADGAAGAAGATGAVGGADAPSSEDAPMPVVEAFPLVEAEPTDGTEGAPTEEAAPPAERRRRLLAMPRPGYSATGKMQSLDGYMLVHIPESAGPGEVFKAKTPSGHIWAFKVPENLPKDRIIKLHLPDLKATARGALLKVPKHASLLHGTPMFKLDEEAPAADEETPAAVEEAPAAAEEDAPEAAGNATAGNGTTVEEGEVEPEEEEAASGGVGFGPGMIPPHASSSQPCCMCPLYDEETGEIEGWIADAPKDPRSAAVSYIVVAQAVADREDKLDDVVGSKALDPSWMNTRFHWDEAPVESDESEDEPQEEAPPSNSTGNATDAANATASVEEDAGDAPGDAPEEEEEAAEEVMSGGVHLASHHVTHLAQKVPMATVVGRVVNQPAPKSARPLGKQSPLQIKALHAPVKKAVRPLAKAAGVSPQKQTPLQAFAMPMAKAAAGVARGQIPKAIEAIAQPVAGKPLAAAHANTMPLAAARAKTMQPKMQASHMAGMKAAPVAARVGPGDMAPVQAVAQPMTAAVAAQKPVQAVAQPLQPVMQMAPAV